MRGVQLNRVAAMKESYLHTFLLELIKVFVLSLSKGEQLKSLFLQYFVNYFKSNLYIVHGNILGIKRLRLSQVEDSTEKKHEINPS